MIKLLKNNFLAPIIILLIIFIVLTIQSMSNKYHKAQALRKLSHGIEIVNYSSKLIHSLQAERGLSVGYIAINGKQFKNQLLLQRQTTDKLYKKFINSVTKNGFNTNQLLIDVLKLSKQLKTKRLQIDTFKISTNETIDYYSKINEKLSLLLLQITELSDPLDIRRKILTYYQFITMKEYIGIERALGMNIVAKKTITIKMKLDFHDKISKQNIFEQHFLNLSSQKNRDYYHNIFKGSCLHIIQTMRDTILTTKDKNSLKIDIVTWYNSMTKKMDKLEQINSYLLKEIQDLIKIKMSNKRKAMLYFIVINIINILIFVYMIYLIINTRKNELKLQNILDVNIISSTTDLKGNITSVSSAFCKISGYTKEELIGKPHSIIRHPDVDKKVFENIWSTLKQNKKWSGKLKNMKKDGGYYWVQVDIEPLVNSSKKTYGYLAIRQDITSQVQLAEQMRNNHLKDQQMIQQSKLAQMGEMISMIAHQWRQPLGAITARVGALLLQIKLKQQIETQELDAELKKINNYAQHLSSTINDFRGFFKNDKTLENTTLKSIVESTLDIVQISLNNKKIQVITNFNCGVTFKTYASELKQVVLNILNNAEDILIENKVKNATITINTVCDIDGKNQILIIKDNAGGIPNDIISKIFDPYFSTKLEKNGTGLGLYMSKTIIEKHCNGRLTASNDNDGAVFKIELNIGGE